MYYTAHLTDYPELCYGYNRAEDDYEFGTMGTIDEYQGKTEAATWAHLNRNYPGIPDEVFTVTGVPEYQYGINYRVPKDATKASRNVNDYVVYTLQKDNSLVRIAQSMNAYTTRSLSEALSKVQSVGILTDCASIVHISDDF